MRRLSPITALLLAAALAACTRADPALFGEPSPLAVPAGTNVVGPRFAAGPDGNIVLSWMQREKSGATLRFSALDSGEWQDAVDVVTDPKMFVNWADLPSVKPLGGTHWVAHWLSRSAASTYAYDILLAQSTDQGQSWGDPVRPHSDGTPTEHGFVSIHAQGHSAALLWLDGRKTGNEASDDPSATSMTLRSALVGPDGAVSQEQLLDEIVCDCCQTDVAVGADGPIAVYRDRTADEIRDIYVSRFSNGAWQPGAPIANDGWKIGACPVNGPAIDAQGDLVAIAWFSAADGNPVVRTALSTNGGRSFKEPVEVASRGASGHVGISIIDRSSVAVSWVQSDKRGTNAINIRSVTASGRLGRPQTVGRTDLVNLYPQMIRSDDMLILAWTDEILDEPEIVSIRVPILGFYDRRQ
ncbi:MAG: hypothetical protein KJO01_12590 [Gammaproteobacteria bacterium]|nr:hypothetical protein [Gammaproteobacteria bacterium]MBT8110182.1 hypothetical protein [Gammaproteobacteria bacterium]NND46033.1 hypothetical protein [Woeseiaceae bacterium]NNL44885.1 hypothetical protein [Woeseiaceae bacterium]